jgi:AhpD family alkylhydroperoxidase
MNRPALLTVICLTLWPQTALAEEGARAPTPPKAAAAPAPASAPPKKAAAAPAPASPKKAAAAPATAPASRASTAAAPAATAPAAGPAAAASTAPALAAADRARADIKTTWGFLPAFLKSVPEAALPGAWEEMKALQLNPNTALPSKIKELIGLAVAAQVPCQFCVYAHTGFAEMGGASKQEIGEAVMIAALVRHWSTVFQGHQTNLAAFRSQVAGWLAHAQKRAPGQGPAAQPAEVVDAATAKQDMQRVLGSVPEFAGRFPPEALAGAWKELRDLEMSPSTALSSKHKSLIGLAVSSQIPCRFCIAADTEFAKAEGATEREIDEAIAMAAITSHWSTYLNGVQTDMAAFKRDVDRLVRIAKRQQARAQAPVAAAPPRAPFNPAANLAATVPPGGP